VTGRSHVLSLTSSSTHSGYAFCSPSLSFSQMYVYLEWGLPVTYSVTDITHSSRQCCNSAIMCMYVIDGNRLQWLQLCIFNASRFVLTSSLYWLCFKVWISWFMSIRCIIWMLPYVILQSYRTHDTFHVYAYISPNISCSQLKCTAYFHGYL